MINIRPISDLRNKFPEIECIVKEGEAVYLTKNGYGTMVVMSIEHYSAMTEDIETRLDEADQAALSEPTRLSADQIFTKARKRISHHEKVQAQVFASI